MIALLLSATVVCVGALALGQAALRLCGATVWSWLAAPIGLSIMMVIAVPAIHVPGRVATVTVVLTLMIVAAAMWCLRAPAHRPPLAGLAAAAPVALLAVVPFLASGRVGTLGVGVDNDMAVHLSDVEAYLSPAALSAWTLPNGYPLGPHAVVAALAKGLSIRVDLAFAGLSLALPVLTAWTALHVLRRPAWFGRVLIATVVGMPYLVAAYYGEGSFKEVLEAQLVLATALWLERPVPASGRARWLPLLILLAGSLSVYSVGGMPWPAMFLALWLAGRALEQTRRRGRRAVAKELRTQLPRAAVALALLLVVMIPQLPRLWRFLHHGGLQVAMSTLGNLAAPVPGWEVFGVWNNPDVRYPPHPGLGGALWVGFAVVLVVYGGVWSLRQSRWMLPAAVAASGLIWIVSTRTQSPYFAAKALVVMAPLVLALAALPLAELPLAELPRAEHGSRHQRWRALAPLLAVLLVARVYYDDLQAMRSAAVGPTDHLLQLRTLRATLHGEPSVFLGNDDFIRWELAGGTVSAPVVNSPELPFPPAKQWVPGQALDFDSVTAETLNGVAWVITTRDGATSAPPPELRLVRVTRDFALWRRDGTVQPSKTLAEGQNPGAVLNCTTPAGQALSRTPGSAEIGSPPVVLAPTEIAPGSRTRVAITLGPGSWALEAQYRSPGAIEVNAPGILRTRLSANLDRLGPRWPIGRITLARAQSVALTLSMNRRWLTPTSAVAGPIVILASALAPERTVPLRRACGMYVDHYRTVGVRAAGAPHA